MRHRFWAAALAAALVAPATAGAQSAVRDSGLILSTPEAAIAAPVERYEDGMSLIVDLSDRMLYVISGGEVKRQFPVSVGSEG